jgi:hypothetical protein
MPNQPYGLNNNPVGYPPGGMVPTGLPTTNVLASNAPVAVPTAPPVYNRPMVDGSRRTLGADNLDDYPANYPSSSPSFLFALMLLISIVGNIYLIILLNQLLMRYRSLQAASRGMNSLANG